MCWKFDNSCNLFAKRAMTKTRPIISSSVVITVCRKWRTSLCRWLSLGCTSLSSSTVSAVIKPCWNCKSSLCRLLSLWYTSVGHECHVFTWRRVTMTTNFRRADWKARCSRSHSEMLKYIRIAKGKVKLTVAFCSIFFPRSTPMWLVCA